MAAARSYQITANSSYEARTPLSTPSCSTTTTLSGMPHSGETYPTLSSTNPSNSSPIESRILHPIPPKKAQRLRLTMPRLEPGFITRLRPTHPTKVDYPAPEELRYLMSGPGRCQACSSCNAQLYCGQPGMGRLYFDRVIRLDCTHVVHDGCFVQHMKKMQAGRGANSRNGLIKCPFKGCRKLSRTVGCGAIDEDGKFHHTKDQKCIIPGDASKLC